MAASAMLAGLCLAGGALAAEDGLARLPPMGWRSWNFYACAIDQSVLTQQLDAIADRSRLVDGKATSLADLGSVTLPLAMRGAGAATHVCTRDPGGPSCANNTVWAGGDWRRHGALGLGHADWCCARALGCALAAGTPPWASTTAGKIVCLRTRSMARTTPPLATPSSTRGDSRASTT